VRGKSGQVNFKMPDDALPMYGATLDHFGGGVREFWLSLYREYIDRHGKEIALARLASIEAQQKELDFFKSALEEIVGRQDK